MSSLRRWIRRYWLAEMMSSVGTFGTIWVCLDIWSSPLLAAGISPWTANFGFYGTFFVQRIIRQSFSIENAFRQIARMSVEFGPSELLDSFVTRPTLIYFGLLLFDPVSGAIISKIIADIVFYMSAIWVFELQRRRRSAKLRACQK